MESGTTLHDLSVIIVCAGTVTILFKILRLPVLLGYLLSGLLVGPNFLPQSPIQNLATISDLSELGVAFLMFYIGLEFDLRKLQRIMGSALLAVTLQTVVMIFLGMVTAPLLGWSSINGLFLGCLLAISSTMIALPIIRTQNALKSNFAQVAIGILIMEDILAILVLVILTGVGVSGTFKWEAAWQTAFFVGVFVVMVFFLGKLCAPGLLRLIKKFGNPEMVTVTSVAILLGIGMLAEHFEFSIALGAFLAGSILSQSELAHEIESVINPLKDLFTAVFFVAIGMLIEPNLLKQYWLSITLLTIFVVLGKSITTWVGLFLSGEKPRTAFRACLCKAQIGEFSFIIAGLGAKYSLTEPGLTTIAVGVALGTIIIIPPLSGKALSIFSFLERRLPGGIKDAGNFYINFLSGVKEQLGKSAFLMLVKRPLFQIIGYFLLFNGVLIMTMMAGDFVTTRLPQLIEYQSLIRDGIWLFGAILCLPFLIAIIRNIEVIILMLTEAAFSSKAKRVFRRGRMINVFNQGILCLVVFFLGGIYLSVVAAYLPSGVALSVLVTLIVGLSFFFWRHIIRVNSRLERLFMESFTSEVKSSQETRREAALKSISERYPWPVRLHDIELKPNSVACGLRIHELNLRERTGVSIVGISRDNFTAYDPAPDVPLFPGDHLIIIGSDEESNEAKKILRETEGAPEEVKSTGKFQIEQVYLSSDAPIVGSTLAEAHIRRDHQITVIGIHRGEKRITAPTADEILKLEDILVVVGNSKVIRKFRKWLEGAENLKA